MREREGERERGREGKLGGENEGESWKVAEICGKYKNSLKIFAAAEEEKFASGEKK